MDDKDLKVLIESYYEIYDQPEELTEQIGVPMKPGESAAKALERISQGKIKASEVKEPKLQKENAANLIRLGLGAGTALAGASLMKKAKDVAGKLKDRHNKTEMRIKKELRREEMSAYDVVLDYLLSEGYAETVEDADKIMLALSSYKIQQIVEGDALQNTIKALETKRDAMNKKNPGSANVSRDGKQSVGAAAYKAYQRLRGV